MQPSIHDVDTSEVAWASSHVEARGKGQKPSRHTHSTLLSGDWLAVVGLVPLSEGGGVDLDDGALDEGVCPDELVVGRVVDDPDDAGLAGDVLGAPGVVARLEAERAVLGVAPAHPDGVDPLRPDLGHRALASELELSLLAVVGTLGAGGGPRWRGG